MAVTTAPEPPSYAETGEALARRPDDPLISIVVPVFNEEGSVGLFVEAVDKIAADSGLRFEYVFVNDGSSDATLARLIALQGRHANLRIVDLSRNFGKEAALTAGLEHARGDVSIPMDADLQDPPELIPEMVGQWRRGFDVVEAVRVSRVSDSAPKRYLANAFYVVIRRLAAIDITANAGDFRLMDRRAVAALLRLPERNRFMKGLFAWIGFPSIEVTYDRPPRAAGRTKFNLWKLWNFALDGIFSHSTAPLRIWTYFGLLVALGAVAYAVILFLRTLLFGSDLPGYASLMIVILVTAAIQFVSIGILGEYLGRVLVEAKQRPLYIVREVHEAGSQEPLGGAGGRGAR